MTVRDEDVEYAFDDPDEGWFGMAQPVDVTPPRPAEEVPRDEPPADPPAHACQSDDDTEDDTDRWFVQDMNVAAPVEPDDPAREEFGDRPVTESIAATLNIVPTRRNGFVAASAPSSWESRLSNSGAWDFKANSGDAWYRSKVVMMSAAIVAGVLAIVAVVLVLRSPAPAVEDSTTVPPSESAAPPAPTTSAPVLSSEVPLPPGPPPGPPPPPPPSAEQVSPPVVTRQYTPNYQTPDEPKKPQTNVTRAPISATPPPPPRQTDRGRATPGESGHHGFFG
ncbi:MAG: hypothetical protein QOE74_708 [Mycobacterium sp.]|nr:hypothetical protein [Mycobacterium sp.]